MTARLVVEIPGNPWAARANARSGVSRGRIFKNPGYRDAQDRAAQWIRAAVRAQGVTFPRGPVVVVVTWYLDRRSHQHGLPEWCPAADVDGPGKAYLDALRSTIKRGRSSVPGGGALTDDVQVVDFNQRKRVGEPRAVLTVRAYVDRAAGVC
jgi:hypothetical protein